MNSENSRRPLTVCESNRRKSWQYTHICFQMSHITDGTTLYPVSVCLCKNPRNGTYPGAAPSAIFNRNHDACSVGRPGTDGAARRGGGVPAVRLYADGSDPPMARSCGDWMFTVGGTAAGGGASSAIYHRTMTDGLAEASQPRQAPIGTPRGRCEHASAPTGLGGAWQPTGSPSSDPLNSHGRIKPIFIEHFEANQGFHWSLVTLKLKNWKIGVAKSEAKMR